MFDLFLRLFDKKKVPESAEAKTLEHPITNSKKTSGRQFVPIELDWSKAEYIPLPPSPPTWEVDGRDEFNREYTDLSIKPVFDAWHKKQYTKTVNLASTLSPKQRQGRIGEIIAKAYCKLIIQRMQAGQLAAATKQSIEMFELVPSHVKDTDHRRFNQILTKMDKVGKKHNYTPIDVAKLSSLPLFTVSEGSPWILVDERKLENEERPHPAFDIISIDTSGTWLLDRSGSSLNQPDTKSVIRRIDRNGILIGEKALNHDVHHVRTSTSGSSITIMSSDGILYIYDESLNLIVENNLSKDKLVVDHFRTIETNYWGEFRSQIRAIDIAPEGDRYLFTLADEAWCRTTSGNVLWGVVMPLKEGWKRLIGRSERFGTSQEVNDALHILGLSLPVSLREIKQQRRILALANHPDHNTGDPTAAEKMKSINNAFEILTGVDPNTLDFEESDITYFARTSPDHIIEADGFRLEITLTGSVPQDWIYAASFSSTNDEVYLATYSGKIILASRDENPIIVYDIGTCPNKIIDTGPYTYFLTYTRLYIIEDKNKLAACLDIYQQGKLLISQTRFGLYTNKHLQWFTNAGVKIGEITSRDPIRAISVVDGDLIIQTRQHQVKIKEECKM